MSKTGISIIVMTAAIATSVVLAFFVRDILNVIPFWIAPVISIVAFAVAAVCIFTRLGKTKLGFVLLMLSLYIYLIAIIFIQN